MTYPAGVCDTCGDESNVSEGPCGRDLSEEAVLMDNDDGEPVYLLNDGMLVTNLICTGTIHPPTTGD